MRAASREGAVSDLRIFETPAGAVGGACVEQKYGVTIIKHPSGAYDIADPDEHPDVYPYEANAWTGGYCCECWLVMPADGHPCGRPPPHADQAESLGEYLRRVEIVPGTDADNAHTECCRSPP